MSAATISADETAMVGMCHMTHDTLDERDLFFRQSLKYADDLVKVYEDEKRKREVLEEANRKLVVEIAARRQAEYQLRMAHEELDRRVRERTEELSVSNEKLKLEIAQRVQAEARIRGSLREKETLLSEIHHRVKNNLQIVSSLLALQSERVNDPKVVDALRDSQGRIRSMALIHDQLYRSADLSRIDYKRYLESLAESVIKSHSNGTASIRIRIRADHVFLSVAQALPCSLVINELVSNAFKHAFPGSSTGAIHIEFLETENGTYTFTVEDNGRGLPRDFDIRQTTSLGLQLVINLVEAQLRGSIEVMSSEGTGTTFRATFPSCGRG
jgi:two-component sensor histidine kinase